MSRPTYRDATQTKYRVVALTGLEEDEFDNLLPYFSRSLKERMAKYTIEGSERENSYAGYSNSPMPTDEDKLLFVLMFLKHNLSQDILAFMYEMSQGKVHHYLYTFIPSLRDALLLTGDLPARTKEAFESAVQASSGPLFVTTV
jgi:hypothetical protein